MKSQSQIYVTELNIYPIKSCKGITLNQVVVTPKGPEWDRRWMLIDSNGRFMSQRQHPTMALIDVKVEPKALILRIKGQREFRLPIIETGTKREVTIWKDTTEAIDLGDEIAKTLSTYLETECRLVYMLESTFRQVNQKYSDKKEDQVGFADGYPFLLISEESLKDLNSRLKFPVPMNRFRTNIVIKGCSPYEEDTWSEIRIGNIQFKVAKPCSRCIVTTIDQKTSKKSEEPLKTLALYRKQEKGVMFGQNLIHHNLGQLSVGDSLEILNKK